MHGRPFFLLGPLCRGDLFGLEALGLDGVVLEHLNGGGHPADFVAPADADDPNRMIAFGQRRHGTRHAAQGAGDAAHDNRSQACGGREKDNRDRRQNDEGMVRGLARRRRGGNQIGRQPILDHLQQVDLPGDRIEPRRPGDLADLAAIGVGDGDLAHAGHFVDRRAADRFGQKRPLVRPGIGGEYREIRPLLGDQGDEPPVHRRFETSGAEAAGAHRPLDPRPLLGLEKAGIGADRVGQRRVVTDDRHLRHDVEQTGNRRRVVLRHLADREGKVADRPAARLKLREHGLGFGDPDAERLAVRGGIDPRDRGAETVEGDVRLPALLLQPLTEFFVPAGADIAGGVAAFLLQLMDEGAGIRRQLRHIAELVHLGGDLELDQHLMAGETQQAQDRQGESQGDPGADPKTTKERKHDRPTCTFKNRIDIREPSQLRVA